MNADGESAEVNADDVSMMLDMKVWLLLSTIHSTTGRDHGKIRSSIEQPDTSSRYLPLHPLSIRWLSQLQSR